MLAVKIDDVKDFWNSNPLCAAHVPFPPGSKEFFEHYDRLREEIETPAVSEAIHEYARFKGKRVLDVGCGNGYVLSRYARAGAEVYGIDLTPAALKITEARFSFEGKKVNLTEGNAEELPYPDRSFDCVTSMGVLHHTPHTQKAIDEIFRVLKPGGLFVIMLYHRRSALYQSGMRLWSIVQGKPLSQKLNEYDGPGNPLGKAYSRSEMRQMLKRFENVNIFSGFIHGTHFVPFFGRLLPQKLIKPLEKLWGFNLYGKAYKPS